MTEAMTAALTEALTDPVSLIHHLSRRAIEADEAQTLLDEMNQAAMEAVGADRAFIALAHDATGELTLIATAGSGWTDEFRAMRLRIDETGRTGKPQGGRAGETRSGITSHVAATGRPYITGDVDADPYYYAFFDDVCSEIAVPLLDGNGHTRGVINIESFRPDHFNDAHLRLVQSLADIAAMRLLMDGYRAREAALVEIGKDLSAIGDTEQLMRRVVDVASAQLRFEDCSLFVLDKDKQLLVLQAARGGLAGRIGTATYPVGEGLTGWVAEHGEPIRVGSPRDDPRWKGRYEEFPISDVGAFLAVPDLRAQRRPRSPARPAPQERCALVPPRVHRRRRKRPADHRLPARHRHRERPYSGQISQHRAHGRLGRVIRQGRPHDRQPDLRHQGRPQRTRIPPVRPRRPAARIQKAGGGHPARHLPPGRDLAGVPRLRPRHPDRLGRISAQ